MNINVKYSQYEYNIDAVNILRRLAFLFLAGYWIAISPLAYAASLVDGNYTISGTFDSGIATLTGTFTVTGGAVGTVNITTDYNGIGTPSNYQGTGSAINTGNMFSAALTLTSSPISATGTGMLNLTSDGRLSCGGLFLSGMENCQYTSNVGGNNPSEKVGSYTITGPLQPDILLRMQPVLGGAPVNITNGDIVPTVAELTDYGSVPVGTAKRGILGFVNSGLASLNISNIAITGPHASDFTTISSLNMVALSSTGRDLLFTPSGTGLRTATVTVTSNDPDESPYTFSIQGTGTPAPEIDIVRNPFGSIADGSNFPLGNITAGGAPLFLQFQIRNTGTLNLDVTSITSTNENNVAVNSIIPANTTIIPGGNVLLNISLTAIANGAFSFDLDVVSNDADESNYDIEISGNGVNAPAGGTITLVQNIKGTDRTVNFTSLTTALNFALTTVSGTATNTFTNIATGTHTITAEDLGAAGYGVTSIACNDTDSTGDIVTRTVSINLAAGENVTCSFTTVESRSVTSQQIADYLGARNTLLLDHQPKRNRRLEKLKATSPSDSGQIETNVLGFLPARMTTGLPFNATVNEDKISYSGSLSSYSGAGNELNARAKVYNDKNKWDIWTEGHIARFDDSSSRGGNFGVIYGGIEYLARPEILIGLMGQYDWLDQSYSTNAKVEGNGWMIGPYTTIRLNENYYFDIRSAWGRSSNNISPFGTYTDEFETERWLVSAAFIGEFQTGPWTIKPGIALQYIEEQQSAYTDFLNVVIPKQIISQGDIRFGPRISYAKVIKDGLLTPWVQFDGVYTFGDGGNLTNGSIANEFEGLAGKVEAGFDLKSANGLSLSFSGQISGIGTNARSYGGMLNLSIPLN